MRAILQRVETASVAVEGKVVGECGKGLMILVCAMQGDSPEIGAKMAQKIVKMRIFQDEAGKMNRSIRDIEGSILVVSQFTLAADLRGNRPGFSNAAPPDEGRTLYEGFVEALRQEGLPCQTGIFGADMKVSLINDGPVTIWMDSATL